MLELIWVICVFALPAFGVPMAVIGVIMGLCEWSWEKPAGSMGSLRLVGTGIVLCLPLIWYIGPAVVDYLFR